MTVLKNIHHLTFVVADLDAAVAAYQSKLGLEHFIYDELPRRGVTTARVQVGDAWIVLVSPQDNESEAARHLAANGEGLFLMSFGVDDLDQAIVDLAARGTAASERRVGVDDWLVADIDTATELNVNCHLTQSDRCVLK